MRRGRHALGIRHALLLLCCSLAVFHNTLDNSFHYDDEHSIVRNPHIRSLRALPRLFQDAQTFSGLPGVRMYRPLTMATFALNYALERDGVSGYHLVNWALHLGNALLLWRVLGRLVVGAPGALVGALFFLVHPLVGEPVNYISSRASLLAVFFMLLALVLLDPERYRSHPYRTLLLGVGCVILALLSKSSASVFPLLLGTYAGWRRLWRWRLQLLLSGGAVLVYIVYTRLIISRALLTPVRPHVVQWATQLKAAVFYLQRLIMPVQLSVEPQFRAAGGAMDPPVLWAAVFLGCLAWVVMRARAAWPLVTLGVLWMACGLLPTAVVPLHVLVNDHRLYLSVAGGGLVAAGLFPRLSVPVRGLWLAVLVLLGGLCLQRNPVWHSEESLWREAVARGPLMARPYVNLARACLERGRVEEAIGNCRRALDLDPSLALAHYNLGTAYLRQGRPDLAIPYYERALECQPDLNQARNNLANALLELGDNDAAIAAFRQALLPQPHAAVLHNLAKAFLQAGRADSARCYFQLAVQADPDLCAAYQGWAQACLREDLIDTAREVLGRALRRWPGDTSLLLLMAEAHASLGEYGRALQAYGRAGLAPEAARLQIGTQALRRGRWLEARRQYQQVLDQDPHNARALDGLGQVQVAQDHPREALGYFRQAARAAPEWATPYAHIGQVNLRQQQPLEAVAALERARSLQPEVEILGLLAQAYQAAGRLSEAEEVYRSAMAMAPQRLALHYNLATVLAAAGRPREAEAEFRRAAAIAPGSAQTWLALGCLLLEQERYAAAESAFVSLRQLASIGPWPLPRGAAGQRRLRPPCAAAAACERQLGSGVVSESVRERIEALRREFAAACRAALRKSGGD